MKRLIIILMLLIGLTTILEAKSHKQINVFNSFYSHLSPYGVWMEFDDGLVVWRPTIMRRGWAPYSIGRWIWTDYGWYWDSYESFGYITYHYGRWYYDDYYGWVWIPDYNWAPAWVEWRYDDSYIGWAPLPPYAIFSVNIGIHFTFNYVTPYSHWHFVNYNRMCDPYVYKHYVGPKYKYRVYSNTKYRNDYGYSNGRIINRGVDIGEVRTRSGQDIRQRNLQQVSDVREISRSDKDRKLERSTDAIRTYIASRDELMKENVRDTDVRKIERRSTLETSKLQLGDRKDNRVDVGSRNRNDELKNVGRERELKENTVENNRRDNLENRKQNDGRSENVNERQKRESSIIENQSKRNNNTDSRIEEREVRKERNFQNQRDQNEVKVERKKETNTQENRTINRNDEQKKNDARNNERSIGNERKTSQQTRNR